MFVHKLNKDIELKLLEIYHAEEMFNSIDYCREHLREYLPWVDSTRTIDDAIKFIQSSKNKYAGNKGFDAGIWYKKGFAGVIGLHSINPIINSISIGYWLDKRYIGKGIMTRACVSLIDYVFNNLDLNRIEIQCAITNSKSRAIPERLGFMKEGIIRDGELLYENYVDCIVYSILKRDWESKDKMPVMW